ncbi:MAG: CehA/McbA family metallohydrolase, partial [Chloroflexota bacterium]
RAHFFIGEHEATPGYLAGLIHAGRWHIILGLYRVAPEGCDYIVTIELTPSGKIPNSKSQIPTSTLQSPPSTPQWYRGDLQSHTHHSDGKGSLATLIATARARGLDFLAVTDHNTISHVREFTREQTSDLLLIPATEVTTYYGHMNVWGVREWLDFRCRDAATMRRIIAEAHRRGCLASVNHPKTGGPPWEYGDDLEFDCIEVWQAPWPFYNVESFAWWESLLRQGRRIVAVGGSDYHQPVNVMEGNPHLLGHPTTWVYAAELSVDSILHAIRHGHVFISADVDGPRMEMTATDDDQTYQMGDAVESRATTCDVTLRADGALGCHARLIADGTVVAELPIDAAKWSHTWRDAQRATHYIRAEIILRTPHSDDWVMRACGNPIYF